YDSRGRSSANGSYAVAVFAGDWSVGPSSDELTANGWLGQSADVSLTNGQALLQNLQIQLPTAHLRGRVVDGSGSSVGNMSLVANLVTGPGPSSVNLGSQTLNDGTFDMGVFGGTWSLSLECQSPAARGL